MPSRHREASYRYSHGKREREEGVDDDDDDDDPEELLLRARSKVCVLPLREEGIKAYLCVYCARVDKLELFMRAIIGMRE